MYSLALLLLLPLAAHAICTSGSVALGYDSTGWAILSTSCGVLATANSGLCGTYTKGPAGTGSDTPDVICFEDAHPLIAELADGSWYEDCGADTPTESCAGYTVEYCCTDKTK